MTCVPLRMAKGSALLQGLKSARSLLAMRNISCKSASIDSALDADIAPYPRIRAGRQSSNVTYIWVTYDAVIDLKWRELYELIGLILWAGCHFNQGANRLRVSLAITHNLLNHVFAVCCLQLHLLSGL